MSVPQSPAVYTLLQLHARLGGQIQQNRKEATKLRSDMKHVEAVLRLLRPEFDARSIAPKRRNIVNPWYKRGTVFRAALGVLRDATAPMCGEEIALALLAAKGVTEPTRDQRRHMTSTVDSSLRRHDGKTVEADDGRPRRWRISESKP